MYTSDIQWHINSLANCDNAIFIYILDNQTVIYESREACTKFFIVAWIAFNIKMRDRYNDGNHA